MFPLCISVMLLCLQCGWGYNAVHIVQMMDLQVEYGESATLPCNGSVLREEEGSVRWEVMGEDVAVLQGGEFRQGDKYKDRVRLASEEKLREGDWSVVLQHAVFSDSDMYECIWQERKTISIVWLTVMARHVERSLEVAAGDAVLLTCSVQISRSQSPDDLQVWWTRNGSTVLSTKRKALFSAPVGSNPEDTSRLGLLIDKEVFHLHMNPTMMSDNGEYHCWYKTKDSDDPKPGIPESITLTVLETNPADLVFHPDETTTGTEDWVSTSPWFTIPRTEDVADVETTESPLDLTTVLLEVSTLPMKATTESQPMEGLEVSVTSFPEEATTESQPMEGLEVSVTSFPEEGTPETSESLRRDTLPWIRIGLIAGVLLVTAVILCILGALRKM